MGLDLPLHEHYQDDEYDIFGSTIYVALALGGMEVR